MTGEEIIKLDRQYNLHPWSAQAGLNPVAVDRADGIYFWDTGGRQYYDMSSQLVNVNVGHNNRKIIEAIKVQADRMPFMGPSHAVDVRSELSRTIIEEIAPDNMGKVFFTLAGAEANENAIKIVRMVTGRHKIFSRYRSFHGGTHGASNLTGEARRFSAETGISGFIKFFDPYVYREPVIKFENEEQSTAYYLAKLEEQIIFEGRDSVAAIFLETVTGSNGVIIPPAGYLEGVRKICTKYGILMVCDEVMSGWCRTGEWFAVDNWKIKPDVITFAKGITSGYAPLGGVIVSREIADHFDENVLNCGATCNAHLLGCAAGIACIGVYRELDLINRTKKTGKFLTKKMADLRKNHPCVGECRNIGLFGMVEFIKEHDTREPIVPQGMDPDGVMRAILKKLRENGFVTYSHENMISISPPLIITEKQIDEAFNILDRVCTWIDGEFL